MYGEKSNRPSALRCLHNVDTVHREAKGPTDVKQGKTGEGSLYSDDRQPQPTKQQHTNQNNNTEPSQSGGGRHPKGPQETTRHGAQTGVLLHCGAPRHEIRALDKFRFLGVPPQETLRNQRGKGILLR